MSARRCCGGHAHREDKHPTLTTTAPSVGTGLVRVTPLAHRAKWAQKVTEFDPLGAIAPKAKR